MVVTSALSTLLGVVTDCLGAHMAAVILSAIEA
jgi:hypothetical protein